MAYKDKSNAVAYNNKWIGEKYDRINLLVPKGDRDRIRARAEALGESVQQYINRLIADDMRERRG